MRDIAITLIVLAAMVYAFRRPWAGVMLWTWISVMNPHRLTWGFAFNAPFAAMAAGVTLLSLLITKEPVRLPRNGAVTALILFIAWMVITTALAIDPGGSLSQLNKVVKIQLMTLVALAVLHQKEHIQIFVWVNALSLGFYGLKGGIHTILTAGGSRVWGPGGFIGGNNEIGLAMLVVIPLLYYLFLQATRRWLRYGLIGLMTLTAISVLGTQSRGAFVGIAAMAVVLWWRAPRKLLSGLLIGLAATVSLAVMSEEFVERMNTINNYEEDSSAVGRLYAWRTAINIANSRPAGAGFAMYSQRISDRYAAGTDFKGKIDAKILEARAAHSIYFQILGEHGWVGLVLFMTVWVVTWRTASRLRKRSRGDPELQWVGQLAGMCQVALVGYGVGGAFLSLAYFDLPFNVMVMVVVTERWLAMRTAAQRAEAVAGAAAPVAAGAALPAGAALARPGAGGVRR
jgi:putative inorganic carbon (HCO3(-)) transporter